MLKSYSMELGGYTIFKDRIQGHGIGGNVYLGSKDGTEYAVKETRYSDPLEGLSEWMFLRILDHENIIKPIEMIVENDNLLYFIFPLYKDSLASYVDVEGGSKHVLPEPIIRNIVYQILDALQYMHSNNIGHRDLKPNNIMLTNDYRVRIIDLGLAKYFYEDEANIYPWVQSPSYRAPEVNDVEGAFFGYGDLHLLGTKMDIYSLGLIMLDLFHGRRIGQVETYSSYAIDHMIEKCNAPVEAKRLMRDCMVEDIGLRPCASKLLESPWFREYPIPIPNKIEFLSCRIRSIDKLNTKYESLTRKMVGAVAELGYGPDTLNIACKILYRLIHVQDSMVHLEAIAMIAAKQIEELLYNESISRAKEIDRRVFLQIFEFIGYTFILL